MRRLAALILAMLAFAQPCAALSPAQEVLLLGGVSGPTFYANPAATGVIPPGLSYASAGVRYYWGASGNLQTAPNNLILYSNNLAGAGWAVSGGTLTPGQADPFGGTGAYRLQEASSAALMAGGSFTLGANYIPSIWAKSNTGLSQNWAFWNGSINVPVTVTTSWTRVYIAYTASGSSNIVFNFYPLGASGDIIVYGAQAEQVTAAQTAPNPFMPTSGSAYFGPVVNDHNPSTLAALGLRSEPQRTNLFLANLAPATQTIAVASGTTYTMSFYGTGSIVLSGAATQTMTGAAGVRTQYSFTASSTSLTATVSGLSATSYPQAEANAFATSPILTYGTAVTVPADNWSFTGVALAQLGSGEACIAIEALAEGVVTNHGWFIVGSGSNSIVAFMNSPTADFFSGMTSGVAWLNYGPVVGGNITTAKRRIAMSWNGNSQAFSYDGASPLTATVNNPTGMTSASLGNGGSGASYCWFSQIMIRPPCTAAQVQRLSTAGANLRGN